MKHDAKHDVKHDVKHDAKHDIRHGSRHTRHSRAGTTRLLARAVLVLVALAGILIGMGIDRMWYVRSTSGQGHPSFLSSPPTPEQRLQRRQQLEDTLGLTSRQRHVVDSIMIQGSARFDSLRVALRPHVDSLVEETRDQIAAVLSPDQRVRFLKMRSAPHPTH